MQSVFMAGNTTPQASRLNAPVVIVGAGPIGIHSLKEIHRLAPYLSVVIYGDEAWLPYNRVRLSGLLSGVYSLSDIETPLDFTEHPHIVQRHNTRIVGINTVDLSVSDEQGIRQPYSALILATGSQPHVPNIPGIHLPGVFRFRDMSDAQALMARQARSRRIVVLGGGLLGLEAAHAMQRHHTEVLVIDHMDRLMPQQLDADAAELLREHVLGLGMQVILRDPVAAIVGEAAVEGVRLRSGRFIACDTLILSVGIRPNIELARDSGIAVGRGIKVDDAMRTSGRNIYAVGECAEHQGRLYGLVAPGLEQASVAVHNILGRRATYRGSLESSRLKVVGKTVYSAGEVGEELNRLEYQNVVYAHPEKGSYRRLVMKQGRLYGAVCFGDWPQLNRLQEGIQNRRRLWPWQRKRFLSSGDLWDSRAAESVRDWPASATVCNCTGVTRGQLTQAITEGANTLQMIQQHTGASSVCGSCRPQVAELLTDAPREKEAYTTALLGVSLLMLVLGGLFLTLPPIPSLNTVETAWRYDHLWTDGILKKFSGFSLLSLALLVGLMSTRKRWKRFRVGEYAGWRFFHAATGILMWLVLLAHTGLQMGERLNFYLMTTFLSVMLLGSVSGLVIGTRGRLNPVSARRLTNLSYWMHVLLAWPLPALIGFHILSVYYF